MYKTLRWMLPVVVASVGSSAYGAAIEEIVVTAEKRETALQDTPIAITAMSSEEIARDRVATFREIALKTPGMVYADTTGFTLIGLRGVGLDVTNLAGEAAVANYADGVYQGQTFVQQTPSFDLERIEVLRGPQGTLYGRNATAGGVNFISKLPGQELEYNAAITLEDYDRRKLEFGANVPLSDNAAFRASITHDKQDEGYRDAPTLGVESDEDDVMSGRFALIFSPSDTVEVILRGDFVDQERSGSELENLQTAPNAFFATPANPGGFLTFPDPMLGGASLADVFGLNIPTPTTATLQDPDDLEWLGNDPILMEIDIYGYSGTVSWDINDSVMLKSITAYRDSEWTRTADSDGTDLRLLQADNFQAAEQFTQEVNLSGLAMDGKLNWIVGGFYFDEEAVGNFKFNLDDFQATFEALFGLPVGGAPLPPGSLAFFGNRLDGSMTPFPFLDFLMEQDSTSIAAFAQGTYAFNDRWNMTAGIRWTEDEKEVTRTVVANISPNVCVRAEDDEEWSETTGTLGVDFKPNDDALIYGKISTGYKAGGFNPGACTGSFDPENITAYEIGTKNQFFDNTLQLNTALFYYDYDDIQINRFIQNTASIENAAKAEIFGFEAEFIAVFASGFGIDGSISLLDSEYDDATFSDPIAGGAPVDVSGNSLIRAPEVSATLGVEYTWPAFGGNMTLRGDASYKDNYYFDVFEASLPNQSEMEQDSFTIYNARLAWYSESSPWEIHAFVENIGDELYSESRLALGTTGAVVGSFSRPRTYGIRVQYSSK